MKKAKHIKHIVFTAILVALIAAFAFLLTPKAPAVTSSAEERLNALKIIYQGAKSSFGYWDLVPNLDWDSLYEEYQGRVTHVKSDWEYYGELRRFVAQLRDGGHTYVTLPISPPYLLPIELRYMEGQFVIWGADSSTVKVPLGSVVTTINGAETEIYLERLVGDQSGLFTPNARQDMLASLAQVSGSPDTLTLKGIMSDGQPFSLDVTYQKNTPKYAPVLDTLHIESTGTPVGQYEAMTVYDCGYGRYRIKFPDFNDERLKGEFDQFVTDYGLQASAFILDTRGNRGGSALLGMNVLSYFSHLEDLTVVWNKADTLPKEYRAQMAKEAGKMGLVQEHLLTQPAVILTDWDCGSAGDDFVAMAKGTDRFTIIGTNTHGGSGELAYYDLPNGGRFAVSSRNTVWGEAGNEIINNGIPPDIWVEQTIKDAINGKDTVMAFALSRMEKLK